MYLLFLVCFTIAILFTGVVNLGALGSDNISMDRIIYGCDSLKGFVSPSRFLEAI